MLKLTPKIFVIIPLLPNRLMIPNPCEIDGINIGNVNNTVNNALCFIFVLFIVYASKYDKVIDINASYN